MYVVCLLSSDFFRSVLAGSGSSRDSGGGEDLKTAFADGGKKSDGDLIDAEEDGEDGLHRTLLPIQKALNDLLMDNGPKEQSSTTNVELDRSVR